MVPAAPRNFREFWPYYLGEHLDARNRWLHFCGTGAALAGLILGLVLGRPWLIGLGLAAGYALAWIGHFTLERNRPATFRHPLYSLMGDAKMFLLLLTGRLEVEIARLHPDSARRR